MKLVIIQHVLISIILIVITGMPRVEFTEKGLQSTLNIVHTYSIDNIVVKPIDITQLTIDGGGSEFTGNPCYNNSNGVFLNDQNGEFGKGCHALFQFNKWNNNGNGLTMEESNEICKVWNSEAVVTKIYSEQMQTMIKNVWFGGLNFTGNGKIRMGLHKPGYYEGTTDLTYSNNLYKPTEIPYTNFQNDSVKDLQYSNHACVTINTDSGKWEPADCKSKNVDGVLCIVPSCIESDTKVSFPNDLTACSGNGQCNLMKVKDDIALQGECTCETGYYGEQCSQFLCYGVQPNNTNVCSGNGTCESGNNCTCKPGYSGKTCNQQCNPGTYSSNTTSTNENNDCAPCPAGYFCPSYGQTTFSEVCPFGTFSDVGSASCSSCTAGYYCPHSKSTPKSRIECKNSYGSPPGSYDYTNCTIPICYGYQATDTRTCSSHGVCTEIENPIENHNCTCYMGYYGENCATNECGGLLPTKLKPDTTLKILSPTNMKYTIHANQIKSYIYDVQLIRNNIKSEISQEDLQFNDGVYSLKNNKTLPWNTTYLSWRKNELSTTLLRYHIDPYQQCQRNIEYYIPYTQNDVKDDWFSLEKQFPIPDTGKSSIVVQYLKRDFTTKNPHYETILQKSYIINHNVSSFLRKLGQGKVETSFSAAISEFSYNGNSMPETSVQVGGLANMACCSFEHDKEKDEAIKIEDIYEYTLYFDINHISSDLKHENITIDLFQFTPDNETLHNMTLSSNQTIPKIITNGQLSNWAKSHNFSLSTERVFRVNSQSGSLNRQEKMVISFATASMPRHLYNVEIQGKVLINQETQDYTYFRVFTDLDIRHPPFKQRVPLGSVIVVVVIAVVSGVLGVVSSSAVIGSIASAGALIVRGGAGIGEKAVKFVTSNLKQNKVKKYPAFDFSFGLVSDKVEQLDTKVRSLQNILRDLRASKYTAYVHCKVCYDQLQKNLASDSSIQHCTTCGFPLLQYMYSEERDELFCILCSLMYRYLNSAHGSHYRCSLHAAGKNKVQGSIYVLYKKHFSVSNAHRKRKASKKSEKLVELIRDPIWKYNLLIRFECLWIVKDLVNEERNGFKSIPIVTKSLLKVRNRISEIGDNMLGDKHPDGSPREIPALISQLDIDLTDPNLPEKHEFYHSLYNNLSMLQNRLQLHLQYLLYQRDIVKTEEDNILQIDSFPEENTNIGDDDLCFSILSNKSNNSSHIMSDDNFSFGSLNGNLSSLSRTRRRDQSQMKIKQEEEILEPPSQKRKNNSMQNYQQFNLHPQQQQQIQQQQIQQQQIQQQQIQQQQIQQQLQQQQQQQIQQQQRNFSEMDIASPPTASTTRLSPLGPDPVSNMHMSGINTRIPIEQIQQHNIVKAHHTTPSPPPPHSVTLENQARTLAYLQAQQMNIERQISMIRNFQQQRPQPSSTVPPMKQAPPTIEFTDFNFSIQNDDMDTISSHGINIMDLPSMFSSPSPEADNELLPADDLFNDENIQFDSLFQQ